MFSQETVNEVRVPFPLVLAPKSPNASKSPYLRQRNIFNRNYKSSSRHHPHQTLFSPKTSTHLPKPHHSLTTAPTQHHQTSLNPSHSIPHNCHLISSYQNSTQNHPDNSHNQYHPPFPPSLHHPLCPRNLIPTRPHRRMHPTMRISSIPRHTGSISFYVPFLTEACRRNGWWCCDVWIWWL